MDPTSTVGVQAKVVSRTIADGSAVPFRVVLTPSAPAAEQVDVTANLVAAVAHALWQARGGDSLGNWVDAESVVTQLLGGKAPPAASIPVNATPATKPSPARAALPEPKPKGAAKRSTSRR